MIGNEHAVGLFVSHLIRGFGREGKSRNMPPVLRTRIKMSAATCNEVLYDPLFFPDPQAGFPTRASSRRVSSA